MTKKNTLTKFLIWRHKHISHKTFVFIPSSVIVELMAGLTAILCRQESIRDFSFPKNDNERDVMMSAHVLASDV